MDFTKQLGLEVLLINKSRAIVVESVELRQPKLGIFSLLFS